MPKYRYEFYRRSITCETYFIEADSEDEARQILEDGDIPEPCLEFVDWMDDDYTLEDSECIDPLYRMVKDHKSVDSLG